MLNNFNYHACTGENLSQSIFVTMLKDRLLRLVICIISLSYPQVGLAVDDVGGLRYHSSVVKLQMQVSIKTKYCGKIITTYDNT